MRVGLGDCEALGRSFELPYVVYRPAHERLSSVKEDQNHSINILRYYLCSLRYSSCTTVRYANRRDLSCTCRVLRVPLVGPSDRSMYLGRLPLARECLILDAQGLLGAFEHVDGHRFSVSLK